jgi:DNA-binding response OmpR family regulator
MNSKSAVLSVDDDENLQVVIGQSLEMDGYLVTPALNAKSALEAAESEDFDVILLDLMLPDSEGLSLIPKFRSTSKAGIIVVSGKSETTEKIVCLEMGADDYMTKPFEMRELSARIKAVLRRTQNGSDNTANGNNGGSLKQAEKIIFEDGWCLDRTQYQLFDPNSVSADLTTGEFKLLEALILSPLRALSREHLFNLTREGRFDSFDRAIDIQIARLRKKLGDDTKSPLLIKTVRGVGYMFNGKIQTS